jgi:hypothetical protein
MKSGSVAAKTGVPPNELVATAFALLVSLGIDKAIMG